MCKHEQEKLIGTKDGFFCSACGVTFATWEELEADRHKDGKPKSTKKARQKKENALPEG